MRPATHRFQIFRRSRDWLLQHWVFSAYFVAWLAYFAYFWSNAIYYDPAGNVQVTHVSIWGDWAAHFTMGSAMTERGLLLLQSPFLYGARFSYPFVSNAISAALVRMGVPFFNAFVFPSFIYSLLLVVALFWFYRHVFRRTTIALIASLIFLFNGGVGFIYFYQDVLASPEPLYTLVNPPREYTSMQEHFIRWISVINSEQIPQRALALGFPLAVIALTLIWFYGIGPAESARTDQRPAHERHSSLLRTHAIPVSMVLLGLMPVIHSHSFMAAGIILSFWLLVALLQTNQGQRFTRFKHWLAFGAGVAAIALPLVKIFLLSNATSHDFIKWFPGWYLQEFDVNWFVFWFLNWGIVPILALAGLFYLIGTQKTARNRWSVALFFAPFFLLFALMNLFLFQPFIWDNTKVLTWASLGISGLAAFFLHVLWTRISMRLARLKKTESWLPLFVQILRASLGRVLIIGMFIFCTLSGFIDTWRIIRFPLHTYQMYSQEEMQLVTWVKQHTAVDSLWMTGDMHNLWLYNLTGRQPMLTFRGWLWTHGYEYHGIEADVSRMFREPYQNISLFDQYGIDYVLIGYDEQHNWNANQQAYEEIFPAVKRTMTYTIYKVSKD